MSDETFQENFLSYFAPMLCDEERNRLYKLAISHAIFDFIEKQGRKPRVLDVGAGTGMLSMFAAEAGARQVVGIEANAFRAKVAEKNISSLGLGRIVKIVNCRSTDFTCDEPFDMVICELMAALVNGEAMNLFINDLFKRGVVRKFETTYCIPSRVKMWLQRYNCKDTDSGLKILQRELIKNGSGQFEKSCSYGIFPHKDSLTPLGPRIDLIDQATFEHLCMTDVHVDIDAGEYLLPEWSCCLFGNVAIENSVESVSRLSAYQYDMRMRNWNFRAFSPIKSMTVKISVTQDDLVVEKMTKRKHD